MKKTILTMVLLLVVISCGGTSIQPRTNQDQFKSGTSGLRLTLVQTADSGYEGFAWRSAFKVENTANYQGKGVISAYVNGVDMEMTDGESVLTHEFTVAPKSQTNQKPEPMTKPFSITLLKETREDLPSPVLNVDFCYDYEIELKTPVCVDFDPLSDPLPGDCAVSESLSVGGGQGGPVSITSIRYQNAISPAGYYTPIFEIFINNVGPGKVRRYGHTKEVCSYAALPENYDVVELTNVRLGGYSGLGYFQCSTEVQLPDSYDEEIPTNKIVCILNDGQLPYRKDYTDTLEFQVNLRYGYYESIRRPIFIEKNIIKGNVA